MKLLDSYPIFEPNQVLSYEHLNNLTSFLVDQARVTRWSLFGKGPFCGLTVDWQSSRGILISKGGALTSEGRLHISDTDQAFTRCRLYRNPENYNRFKRGKKDYYQSWELLPSNARTLGPEQSLTSSTGKEFLADKVVCLYVEESENDLDQCLHDHCINQGKEQQLKWKFLLFSKEDARAIRDNKPNTKVAPTEAQLKLRFNQAYRLPAIVFPRCLLDSRDVLSYEELAPKFEEHAAQAIRSELLDAVEVAANLFGRSLELPEAIAFTPREAQQKLAKALDLVMNNEHVGIQHFWDSIRHIYTAYQEFVDTAFSWVSHCLCDSDQYTHHVFLGEVLPPRSCEPSVYRTRFTFSPTIVDGEASKSRAQFALKRLLTLLDVFEIPDSKNPIQVTPGATLAEPLANRVPPFYYSPKPTLKQWSAEATERCENNRILTYHREFQIAEPAIRDPLAYSLDNKGFLRIENHQGKQYSQIVEELNSVRTRYNLPFKLVKLQFGPDERDRKEDCCCGLEELRSLYLLSRDEIRCQLSRLMSDMLEIQKERPEETPPKEEKPAEGKPTTSTKPQKEDVVMFFNERGDNEKNVENAVIDFSKMVGVFTAFGPAAEKKTKAEPVQIKNTAADKRMFVDRELGVTFQYETTPEKYYELFSAKKLANLLFQEITGRIGDTSTTLANDLMEFDLLAFTRQFEALKTKVQDLRNLILKTIDEKQKPEQRISLNSIKIRLAQQLTAFASHCSSASFRTLVEKREDKILQLESQQTLASFMRQHPGIEHASGVPMAGTFVVVCGKPSQLDRANPLLNRFLPPQFPRPFPTDKPQKLPGRENILVMIEELLRGKSKEFIKDRSDFTKTLRLGVNPMGIAVGSILEAEKGSPAALKIKERPEIREALAIEQPIDFQKEKLIREVISRLAESTGKAEDEGDVVLADFYLPYIASTPCATVEYIVIPEVSLTLPTDCFIADDEEIYPFETTPPGGTIANAPGVIQQNGDWFFIPAKSGLNEGEITFRYTYHGKSDDFTVKIKPPIPVEENPTLTILDGKQPFCPNDKTNYRLVGKPDNGIYSGNAFKEPNFFNPSLASPEDKKKRETELRYTISDKKFAVLKVALQKQHTIKANATPPRNTEKGQIVDFFIETDETPDAILWKFDDGATSREEKFPREFTKSGTYKVIVIAKFGDCDETDETSVTISIPQEGEKPTITVKGEATEYCANDKTSYSISATPLGGKFDGDGIQTNGTLTEFQPSSVSAEALKKGKATISYTAPNGESATIVLGIVQTPDVTVNVKGPTRTDNGFEVVLTPSASRSIRSVIWTLPSGEKSGNPILKTVFKKPGEHVVKLEADIPPCFVSKNVPIVISLTDKPTEPKPTEKPKIIHNPKRFADLTKSPRFESAIGSSNTAVFKTTRALDNLLKKAAADTKIAESVVSGKLDETIEKNAAAAFTASFNKLTASLQSAPKSDLALLWKFNQLTLATVVALVEVRNSDIKANSPIDSALGLYNELAGTLKKDPKSKSLKLNAGLATKLKKGEILKGKSVLKNKLQAIATVLS